MLTFMIFFMIFSLCTTTIKPNPQTHPYCTSPKNNSSSGNTLFTIGLNLIEITNNYHRKELSLAQKTIAVLTTHSSLPLDLLPLPMVGLSLNGFLSVTTSKIDESYNHNQIVQLVNQLTSNPSLAHNNNYIYCNYKSVSVYRTIKNLIVQL